MASDQSMYKYKTLSVPSKELRCASKLLKAFQTLQISALKVQINIYTSSLGITWNVSTFLVLPFCGKNKDHVPLVADITGSICK